MSSDSKAFLKHKAINGWRLFWLISVSMSIIIVFAMMGSDLSSPKGVSHMISFSVRFAAPLIFLIVAISSLQKLFPGPVPMWLLRNQKYIGICFAVAMAWQGAFIFMLSNFFRDYYFEEIFYLRDELEGSTGYILLTAMVVTSFPFGQKHLSPKQWKLIHKTALYFLFAYPFSVYWWNLSYYPDPVPIDYVYYWMGFTAFTLRIAAWGKKQQQLTTRNAPHSGTPLAFKLLGGAMIAFGLFVAATGRQWQYPATEFLLGSEWSANLVLWLPFWPFEPFLSLFIIGLAAMLLTRTRA